MADKMF